MINNLVTNRTYTSEELFDIMREQEQNISRASFYRRLKQSVADRELIPIMRGKYQVANKQVYSYELSDKAKDIKQKIELQFPAVEFAIFESLQLNEFINHQIARNTIFVQVDKAALPFVFDSLKEIILGGVLLNPSVQLFNQYWREDIIVLTRLLTEAPVKDNYCKLEKILVDLFCDNVQKELFSQSELPNLLENAFDKYQIDLSCFTRYAKRRGAYEKIIIFINENTKISNLEINDLKVVKHIKNINNVKYVGNDGTLLDGYNMDDIDISTLRAYEDECNMDAQVSDLDEALLLEYKKILGAENLPTEQVLRARGFIKECNGKQCLTNAAVLLFAKNINQFYPNCRIRFIRYDGDVAKVGKGINIIKDTTIEQPILRIIEKAKEFIATQLREFTALNLKTGKFETVPEYPEFAWLECIVNAVTHREYGLTGSYILVTMYDDRLEIKSPGKLPNIVTVDNIKETRYSRNPRIARVLTDFGWVRELNEGVKRIYSDMKDLFLEEPIYSEPDQYVRLILKNNIAIRSARVTENSN